MRQETAICAILCLKNPVRVLPLHLSFILILSSHPRPSLPNCVCSSCFHTKSRYAFVFSRMPAPRPHLFSSSWCDHTNGMLWGVKITMFLSVTFSPVSCYVFPSAASSCEGPGSIPTKNNGEITASYFSVFKSILRKVKPNFWTEWQQKFHKFQFLLVSSCTQFWFRSAFPRGMR